MPAEPNLLYRPANFFEPLKIEEIFATAQPLEVELGSGDSTLIAELARRTPQRNFLGVERLMGRLRKLDRKGRRLGLANLRGMRIEASYCLEYLLPPQAVTTLHVYFPDPWPKRKHWANRLVNQRFTELAARTLLPEGTIYLRTDHAEYFAQMTEVFSSSPMFRSVETPGELSEVLTDFERDFLAQGRTTHRAGYQRV